MLLSSIVYSGAFLCGGMVAPSCVRGVEVAHYNDLMTIGTFLEFTYQEVEVWQLIFWGAVHARNDETLVRFPFWYYFYHGMFDKCVDRFQFLYRQILFSEYCRALCLDVGVVAL